MKNEDMSHHLFDCFGLAIDYMIVDRETLSIMPIADRLIDAEAGSPREEVDIGGIIWSGRPALQQIRLRTSMPVVMLDGLDKLFLDSIREADGLLGEWGGRLCGSGMHPFMTPSETKNWPNCQGMTIEFRFAGDEELGRLLAAIRLVFPIIPALSASSPIVESTVTGFRDTCLEKHCSLEQRGEIIGIGHGVVEMRLIDTQETPAADIAVAAAVIGVVRLLAHEIFSPRQVQQVWTDEQLQTVFLDTIKNGEDAVITNADYLKMFGISGAQCSVRELWRYLVRTLVRYDTEWIAPHRKTLEQIISGGTLSTRILRSLGADTSRTHMHAVYGELCGCLSRGRMVGQG
ncbi:MAG: hypothetical protein MUF22_06625 [Chitinispirillaceae bacterium]|jgi:hypothetical protein|nr:hypothetical protein [Chitinispirillaceae bacterium]